MRHILEVKQTALQSVFLTWDVGMVKVSVDRQLSPEAPWELVYEGHATYFEDSSDLFTRNQGIMYRVRYGNNVIESALYQTTDAYMLAVAAEYKFILKEALAGRKVMIYVKYDNDEYCPECYNTVLEKQIKTVGCTTCDGSGRLNGGYKGPIEAYLGIHDKNRSIDYTNGLKKKEEVVSAWLPSYPIVKEGDIIVVDPSNIYMVDHPPQVKEVTSDVENRSFLIKQELVLRKTGGSRVGVAIGWYDESAAEEVCSDTDQIWGTLPSSSSTLPQGVVHDDIVIFDSTIGQWKRIPLAEAIAKVFIVDSQLGIVKADL